MKRLFKSIPKQVIVLSFVSLLNDISSEILYPILPIFITEVLHAPIYVIGLIEGIAEGLSSVFKLLFGILSDRLQKRRIFIILGYICSIIYKILVAFASIWPIVLVSRVIDKLGKGLRVASRDALLLSYSNKNNRGYIFGFHRSMDSLGAVIGPFTALILLSIFNLNIRTILYIAIIPALLTLTLIFFIKDKKEQIIAKEKQTVHFSLKTLSPNFKLFLLSLAFLSLSNSSDAFLILRSKDLGLGLNLIIIAYILYNLVYSVLSSPVGIIADKFGAKKMFILGILIYAFVYFSFALNTNPLFVFFLFIIYGAYIAITDTLSSTIIGSFVKVENAASAYGIQQLIQGLFTLLASFIGGILWSSISYRATFYFTVISALISIMIFIKVKIPGGTLSKS